MKSANQNRYWPDQLGWRTGGSGSTVHNGLGKIGSRLPSGQWQFWSVLSGEYPYFGLFDLANNHISVCSVWPIPIFRSARSCQYLNFGLFGLANTQTSAVRSVRSGRCPNFGLLALANTHILVCSVLPIPIFRSVWSG